MRFDRFGFYEFRDTYRKRRAFLRKQAKEVERYPLFAEQVIAEQIDVDTEMAQRQAIWKREHTAARAQRAFKWRQARVALAAFPEEERQALLSYWQRCSCPAAPEYLLSVLHAYRCNRLDLNPQPMVETEECRIAVTELIRRIRERAASRAQPGRQLG